MTERTQTPPVPPAADRKSKTSSTASDHFGGRSARGTDASLTASSLLTPEPESSGGGVPGITRFAAVDLKLAGGSVPAEAGLDWLAKKGYKTLVDLREPSGSTAAFITAASRRGLRCILLPTDAKSVDAEQFARFNFELSLSDARPLYFFDNEGIRAGILWYVRRVAIDKVAPQVARREAEDLGLTDPAAWITATACLELIDRTRSASPAIPGPVGDTEAVIKPRPESGPAASISAPPATTLHVLLSIAPFEGPRPVVVRPTLPNLAMAEPRESTRSADPSPSQGSPIDMRPLTAMLFTGLTLPLAKASRSTFPTIFAFTRANPAVQGQRPRSLPPTSDA